MGEHSALYMAELKLLRYGGISFVSIILFLSLAISNVFHWAVWIPGLIGAIGAFLSISIQLRNIELLRRWRSDE